MTEIWLASASPRRQDLLMQVGFRPIVRPAQIEEQKEEHESVEGYVERLARQKGEAVRALLADTEGPDWIVAADTIVAVDGVLLEKPGDKDEARSMISALSGRSHEVQTAFWLGQRSKRRFYLHRETSRVTFRALHERSIEAYIESDEPYDKAGGYGIQGIAGGFVSKVEGCYTNVVGLPLSALIEACELMRVLSHFPDHRGVLP